MTKFYGRILALLLMLTFVPAVTPARTPALRHSAISRRASSKRHKRHRRHRRHHHTA
jgi:hypothetical protein